MPFQPFHSGAPEMASKSDKNFIDLGSAGVICLDLSWTWTPSHGFKCGYLTLRAAPKYPLKKKGVSGAINTQWSICKGG